MTHTPRALSVSSLYTLKHQICPVFFSCNFFLVLVIVSFSNLFFSYYLVLVFSHFLVLVLVIVSVLVLVFNFLNIFEYKSQLIR